MEHSDANDNMPHTCTKPHYHLILVVHMEMRFLSSPTQRPVNPIKVNWWSARNIFNLIAIKLWNNWGACHTIHSKYPISVNRTMKTAIKSTEYAQNETSSATTNSVLFLWPNESLPFVCIIWNRFRINKEKLEVPQLNLCRSTRSAHALLEGLVGLRRGFHFYTKVP